MIRSAAFKLTMWYLGIIMLVSALFSLALYSASSAQLTENSTRQHNIINRIPLPPGAEGQRGDYNQLIDDQHDDGLHRLQIRLLGLNLATLLLGGGASFFLARRTLRPIEESLEAQGRFTADASHELRTPLTAMRTEIEVALREKQLPAADARELLASNLEEIAKLEALSAGLLRLARSDNGLDPAAVSPVPVSELFEAAIGRHQVQIKQRKITLEASDGGAIVEGDRASLIELVAILLDNAIKYSDLESTINLAAKPSGHFVEISVADQGVGMKASDIPHIFDRFYRADNSRAKASVGGYGLGLSIAKRITDLHHGTISATSTPGAGSTFRVKLPAVYVVKKPKLF